VESSRIPISGIDRQVDEYSPMDGSCSQIDKFRPVGRVDGPRWEVIPIPDQYTFAPDPTWDIPASTPFTIVRTHYAFDTWYAFVFFDNDGGSPETALYSCTLASGVLTLDTQVISAGGDLWIDGSNDLLPIEVFFQNFKTNEFYMLISPGRDAASGQHQLWKVTPDGAKPAVLRPELHLVQVTVNDTSKSTSDFDNLFPATRTSPRPTFIASSYDLRFKTLSEGKPVPIPDKIIQGGTYPGILKNKDKYFGVITAFKHPNGTWVKHSSPHVFKINEQTADIGTDTDFARLSFGLNSNYTDNSTNYDANIGDNFTLYGHRGGGSGSSTPWQTVGEIGIFMTIAKDTKLDAYLEGTYFYLGGLDEDDLLNWSANEEAIATGEVLNIDPFSHHVITAKTIGSYLNNLVLIRTVTNFALPGCNSHSHPNIGFSSDSPVSPKINEIYSDSVSTIPGSVTITSNDNCLIRVKIETDKGTFYRWNVVSFSYGNYPIVGADYFVFLDEFLSYPDSRATELRYYWYESADNYQLISTVELQPHPSLNLAYSLFAVGDKDVSNTRSLTIIISSTGPIDFTDDNNEVMIEEGTFKISDLTKLYFPLEWTYGIKDNLTAVVNNTNEVGQGQFGEYPLYIFGERSVYGARSGNDVLISSLDLISAQHGMNGFESYAVFKNILYFVSSHGIHALSGIRIEDIYDKVEDLGVYFLSTVSGLPSFNQNFEDLIDNSPTTLFLNLLSDAKVFANTKTHEIIFSTLGGLLIYNEKYKQWYTYTHIVPGEESEFDFSTYNQLMDVNGNLFILESPVVTEDATILEWNTGSVSGFFSMVTNPFVYNDYAIMKRLRRMILKGKFVINGSGTGAVFGHILYALNVVLQGKRSTNTSNTAPEQDDASWLTLIIINDNTAKTITSKYLKTHYGGIQAFRILIYGENLSAGSFVSDVFSMYENRGRFVI
jgi:hypothetical protein